jgi:hypothetical protein
MITLIANSGISLHTFEFSIDLNQDLIKPMGFYELLDKDKVTVQYAYYLPDLDIWVPKSFLAYEEYLTPDGGLKDSINTTLAKKFKLNEETDYFTISDIGDCLEFFAREDKPLWLPIPYFKQNASFKTTFGPVAWARMMLKPISKEKSIVKYHLILAFDTATTDEFSMYAPLHSDTAPEENMFSFAKNEDFLLNFFDVKYSCDWVERYIRNIVQKGKEPQEFPFQKHIGYYIYLLKYLGATNQLPDVRLFDDKQKPIDVDLVLDIGNSHTCGVLFENDPNNKSVGFNAVKKLQINDLSSPEKSYTDSFSMRLAFVEPSFGEISLPQHKNFRWPSLLRLGEEASRFIKTSYLDVEKGRESNAHMSSPKRYLWDTDKSDIPWEFINFKGSNFAESIYYEGISEQFKENGDYAYDGNFAFQPYYSRKSLMTFVYIEIFLHAITQINSHAFRMAHGNVEKPRRLRRITITCPTSIIQYEQVTLRECAVEASRALGRFFNNQFIGQFEDNDANQDLEIIPKPKDLAKKISELSFKKDWIYDEATCGQLVFLYAEISQRYLNKASVFFDLYGSKREDVTYPDEKSLTIASIDIGGGTTDLMISAYQYEKGQSMAVLKPHPLYWESFNLAGDELLKELVQQIVIEGHPQNDHERHCHGVIEQAAHAAGVTDIAHKLNNFFGTDNNNQRFTHRVYRKNFVVQVALPIAYRYLNHAVEAKPDQVVSFDELFGDSKPNQQLIDYFNNHFAPLRFENIQWKLSAARVNAIIETTYEPLFKQLSAIVFAYGCDFLLLAGRPTTIPKIREMFIKYYPVSPDRLITLNDYRVGRWYPFANDLGYFSEPKTIVSVGALIALMGGLLDKLDGFRIKTELLKKNLIATSSFIGVYNQHTLQLDEILLTPENNTCEIELHSLPLILGYKQLPNKNYRARPIYKIDFNEAYLKEKALEQNPALEGEKEIALAVEKYRQVIKNRMPLKVKLKREWNNSREAISIEAVKDVNKNENSKQVLKLGYMTLTDENGYWLDTGAFSLNIK